MRVMMRKIVPNSVCEQLLHSYGTTALVVPRHVRLQHARVGVVHRDGVGRRRVGRVLESGLGGDALARARLGGLAAAAALGGHGGEGDEQHLSGGRGGSL